MPIQQLPSLSRRFKEKHFILPSLEHRYPHLRRGFFKRARSALLGDTLIKRRVYTDHCNFTESFLFDDPRLFEDLSSSPSRSLRHHLDTARYESRVTVNDCHSQSRFPASRSIFYFFKAGGIDEGRGIFRIVPAAKRMKLRGQASRCHVRRLR